MDEHHTAPSVLTLLSPAVISEALMKAVSIITSVIMNIMINTVTEAFLFSNKELFSCFISPFFCLSAIFLIVASNELFTTS